MKKGWKIFWITCGVLSVVGVILCMLAVGMGVTEEAIERRMPNGIHLGFLGDDNYDEHEAERNGQILEQGHGQSYHVSSIDIEMWAGEVEIVVNPVASGENNITVATEGIIDDLEYKCYIDDGELKITTSKKVLNTGKVGKVIVGIPRRSQLNEVSVDIGAGVLYIEDIWAHELSVNVGAGEAHIENFQTNELSLECGAGSIQATGAAEREADINCGVGEISFTAVGAEADFDYEIECGIGEVVCGGSRFSGLGREQRIDNGAGKEMNIECGVGTVAVNFAN